MITLAIAHLLVKVPEMRIHFGKGYRVYYKRIGNVIYVLLCGRTQRNDIEKAKKIAKLIVEE